MTRVTKYKITCAKINPIRLREPLKIQTIQPEKYLKYSNELIRPSGHMLPIPISNKVIHHTLTYRGMILSMITRIIQITYSPTYPSVHGRLVICTAIDNGSNNTVGGSYYTLLICQ